MKRKWLKVWACLLVVCMLMGTLAACGGNGEQSSTPSSSSQEESKTPESTPDSAETTPTEEEPGVVDDGTVFPAYDLGGVTITLLNHSDLAAKNPNAEGLEDYQKEERQQNIDRIQEKYNVVLEFVDIPTGDWDNLTTEIVQAFTSGHPVADVMDAYFQHALAYVTNGVTYDFTQDLANSDLFNSEKYFYWLGENVGISSGMGGEGLYYNKEMIRQLGMEYTPAEMFDRGMWSYDDAYNYFKQMKQNMAEDEYPLYVDPYYWILFATAGNGVSNVASTGEVNYLTDAYIECLEVYQKWLAEGLIAPAPLTEDGYYDTWNYPGTTFDKGEKVAMAHRAAWQAEGVKSVFELGFVPYPWGSNVTIGHTGDSGDYKTLSSNYAASYFDGQLFCLTDGIQEKGNPVEILSMVMDLMGWESAMKAYEPVVDPNDTYPNWLEEGIDKDLYRYSTSIERLELVPALVKVVPLQMAYNIETLLYENGSIRSTCESYYNLDMQAMIDAGVTSVDVYHEVEVSE